MSDKRFSVFPTRMTLTIYKGKLKAGIRGHSLLKKKSDALTIRFRSILSQIIDVNKKYIIIIIFYNIFIIF